MRVAVEAVGDRVAEHGDALVLEVLRGAADRAGVGGDEGEDLVLLDEATGALERAGAVLAVVAGEQLDGPAVDAALGVDVLDPGPQAP